MAALAIAAAVVSLYSGYQAGQQAKAAGQQAQGAANYQAAQNEQNAGQAVAAGQAAAAEQNRRTDLIHSRAVALAGASGAGIDDPTAVDLMSTIDGTGSYKASVALYQGAERARQMRQGAMTEDYQGDVALEEGENKKNAYYVQGVSGALGALSSGGTNSVAATMYKKYGGGGPSNYAMGNDAGSFAAL